MCKKIGGKLYKYIGNNMVEVRDSKNFSLLYTTIVNNWEGQYEPTIILIIYPDGRTKWPSEKARQVYHSKHLFTGERNEELESRTKYIDEKLKELGISKRSIGYESKWDEILEKINLKKYCN